MISSKWLPLSDLHSGHLNMTCIWELLGRGGEIMDGLEEAQGTVRMDKVHWDHFAVPWGLNRACLCLCRRCRGNSVTTPGTRTAASPTTASSTPPT